MKLKFFLSAFFISLYYMNFAQIGGNNTYEFLNIPNSARLASLGGNQIAIKDNDLNFVYHNPALLNASMEKQVVLNYVDYVADVKYGYLAYAQSYKDLGMFGFGIHHINYGDFQGADETGIKTKKFYAAEYALNLFYAKNILDSLFSVGVNVKPIYSNLESYESIGLSADFGLTYQNKEKNFTSSFVLKNIGTQIKAYYDTHYEPIPFDIQLGFSQKLKYAPFRFSLTLQHLNNFNMRYDLPENSNTLLATEENDDDNNWWKDAGDEILRHAIIGVEFLPSKHFFVSLAYNYQRRKELSIVDNAKLTGFSFGFGVRVSKFQISYGRAVYHLAGASNHFSLSINLNEFYHKV